MACCTSFEGFGSDLCVVRIANMSGRTMAFKTAVYMRGVAVNPGWPTGVRHEDQVTVRSEGFLTGVSGYVTYELDGTDLTIAFSNPGIGSNKLNAGTNGKGVWDEMDSKDYKSWAKRLTTMGGLHLQLSLKCSGGSTNAATVEIFEAKE